MNGYRLRRRAGAAIVPLAVAMLFVFGAAARATVVPDGGLLNNEVRNDPSFESTVNQRWQTTISNGTVTYASNASLLFGATHFNVNLSGNGDTCVLQSDTSAANAVKVSVTGNDTYRLEFFRQVSLAGNTVNPGVSWYDSFGTLIRTDSRGATTQASTGAWASDTYVLTSPQRAKKAVVFFTLTSAGGNKTVFIDGVGFFRMGTMTAVNWPCSSYAVVALDTQRLVTDFMPVGFARMTRTGLPASCTFSVSSGGTNYANGVSITSLDTFWTLAQGGAAATLPTGTRRDSFITLVSKTTPDSVFGLMATSELPVRIDSTVDLNDGPAGFTNVSVSIRLNASKCTEERVWLRYTTDTWVSDTFIKATGTDTNYTAVIPNVPSLSTISYYAFTSTADTSTGALISSRANYVTLSRGDYCTFTTVAGIGPTINSWHTVQNPAPETGSPDPDLYMRTATNSSGDTMWPRRRTTDNPIIFWVGKTPANETPTCNLFYETKAGYWTSVDASETVTVADSIYFKFILNQADNASFNYGETVGYYFSLVVGGPDSTYCYGNNTVDNITFSDSTKTEATARANPFVYKIRETRPTVSISTPPDGHDTGTASFKVTGVATADAQVGDSVVIYRNGVPTDTVALNSSLAFTGNCTIAAKSDSITVKLTSASFGYTAFDTHRASLYGSPTITMASAPVNGLETNQAYFQMTGTSVNGRPGDSVAIFVDGVATDTVQVDGTGAWSGRCSLQGKGDSVGVRLVNFLGNIAWDTPRMVSFNYHRIGMSWIGILKRDWSELSDTIYNDGTASYTEVVDDPESFSGYMYYNKTTKWLWFRICLDSKDSITWQQATDQIRVFGWMLWLDVNMDGFADWQIGLVPFNKGNGLNVTYNYNNDNQFSDASDPITYTQTNSYKSNGTDSVWIEQVPGSKINGDSDIYLSFGAPISAFEDPAAPFSKQIYETTPFRVLYGTGSSPNAIGRDLVGANTGNYASAFSGAEIVTTANFADGASSTPGGIIYDTRDASFPSTNGTWTQGETVYFSGFTWPAGAGHDSITVRIVLTGLDTATQFSKQGTIPTDSVGSFTGNGFWKPTSSNPAGVYQVWVKHPIAGDTYYFYDQFTLVARVTSISAFTQAPTQVKVDDSIAVVLRDTDQNTITTSKQTVSVTFTNKRTGETEVKTLTETDVNSGFFSETCVVSSSASDSISGSGKLYGRYGDTITVAYTDVQDTTDSVTYTSVIVVPLPAAMALDMTDAAGSGGITLLTENDTLGVRIVDRGLNRDALKAETYSVRITNASTGEQETITLTEVSVSADTFFGTLRTDTVSADSTNQSGIMYATLTQNLFTVFVDPFDSSDTGADTVTILSNGKSALRITNASLVTIDTVPIGGYLYVEVIDKSRNANSGAKETVSATLRSSNGDSENLIILESDNNSGIFRSIGFFVTDSGPLKVGDTILTVTAGATVTCTYVDNITATDSSQDTATATAYSSTGTLIDSTGTAATSQSAGDSIRIRAFDIDENKSAITADTIRVTITNGRTGETEYAVLTETSVSGGGFETSSVRISQALADSVSQNGAIMLLNGDTFTVRYSDANDTTDSWTLGPFTVIPASTVASGTFPPNVKLGDSIIPIIRDSDQNLTWNVIDSITVTVKNTRTGEAEVIVLYETDSNSGVFGVTKIFVTGNIADSVDNETLYALAGDPITVTYTDPNDPTDVVTGGPFSVYLDSTPSSCTYPATVTMGNSFQVEVTDTDQNLDGRATDQITVVFTNNRTGETESITLYENSENSQPFDGTPVTVSSNASDSVSGNGVLFAAGGDTITFRYVDPTDPNDSLTGGPIRVVLDTSAAMGTFASRVRIGDSVFVLITDTDQNRSELVIDTITVTITNNRTGEVETVVMYETNAYSGSFDSPLVRTSSNPADSVDNDTLYVLAGDTLTVRYIDAYDTGDRATSGLILVYIDSTVSSGTFPASVKSGDSIVPVIRDSDQNFNAFAVETITVTVRNTRTGETEVIILYETDSNSGIFDVTKIFVTGNPADSVDNDTLYALAGDTITVSYTDPNDPTDSLTGGPFGVFMDSGPSSGTFPTEVAIGDSIIPIIRDSDQNFSGTKIDTITVTVRNNRTGETEVLILYETDSNSGIFDVTKIFVTGNPADSVDNDTLYAVLGDTISVLYTDPTDPADTLAGGPFPVRLASSRSSGVFPATVKLGDSIAARITDTDQNYSTATLDTISIRLTNTRTGETEIITLTETDTNSGVFDVRTIFVTSSAADSLSGSDTLYALVGDTIAINYTDPTDATDSVNAAPVTVVASLTRSVMSADSRVTIGDSYRVTVVDANVNWNVALQETLAVTITNPATGESEIVILQENGLSSSLFDSTVLPTSSNPADSGPNSGRLYVRLGDTLIVTYTDPYDATDTQRADTGVVRPAATTADSIIPAQFTVGSPISGISVIDTNANRDLDIQESVTVVLTNTRTGETEVLTLYESNSTNLGYFDTATMPTSDSIADSVSGNGKLFAQPGDTVTVTYQDGDYPLDSFVSHGIRAVPALTASTLTTDTRVTIGDSFFAYLRDSDLNRDAFRQETAAIVFRNPATGETETIILYEQGVNTNFFDSVPLVTSDSSADSGSGSGRMYVRSGDTIVATYTDPYDATDSRRVDTGTVIPVATTASISVPATDTVGSLLAGVILYDTNANRDPDIQESVVVTVVNERTGEQESYTLYESGTASGFVFDTASLVTSGNAADSGNATGALYVRAGDTLTVRYTDALSSNDSLVSPAIPIVPALSSATLKFTDANGELPVVLISEGDTIGIRLIDRNRNRDVLATETVVVILKNLNSGETEPVTLTELSASSDTFFGSIGSETTGADSISNNGRLMATVGHRLTVGYTDAYDAADISNDTIDVIGYGKSAVRICNAAFTTTETFPLGSYLYVEVIDRNRNTNPNAKDTIQATVYTSSGDTEILTIVESANNSSIFRWTAGLFVTDSGVPTQNDSILFVNLPAVITCTYVDPSDPTDSSYDTGTPIGAIAVGWLINASGQIVTTQASGDSIRVRVSDWDENATANAIDTVRVVLQNGRTGETEVAILYETDVAAGGFETNSFPLSQSPADSATGNGRLMLLNGDTLLISYQDHNDVSDSFTIGPYVTVPSTSSASGTLPAWIYIGQSGTATVTDADRNANALAVETVTVTVTNNRTGETGTLTLTETAANAATFSGSITTSADAADSGVGLPIYLLAGDTITVRYVDPSVATDSLTLGPATAAWDSTVSSGTFPSTIEPFASLGATIRDSDENRNGLRIDTLVVLVTNNRTGETELLVLVETDSNSGIFNTTKLPTSTRLSDSLGLSGTLRILPGDTLTILYRDTETPTDSTTSAPVLVAWGETSSSGTFPSTIEPGLSIGSTIRDTDANLDGRRIDVLIVLVTNNRTGETELLTLTETDSNSGVFNTTKLPTSTGAGDSGSLSGTLRILPGDTLTILYVDTQTPTESSTSGNINVAFGETVASGVFPSSVKTGDSLAPLIRDSDVNTNGRAKETATVTVTNNRTGETETWTLTETDSNSGEFDVDTMRLSRSAADSLSGSGKLYALAGDTLKIFYQDATTPTDSVTSGAIRVYNDTSTASGVFPTAIIVGDSIVPVVTDTDANRDGTRIETVTVTITNNRTGETEIVILYETDSNSGVFDVTQAKTSGLAADSPSLSDTLYVVGGDTLTARYVDANDPTDSFSSTTITVGTGNTTSSGIFPDSAILGGGINPKIVDTDQNANALAPETISITITNSRTGETETLVLTEIDSNSSTFGVATLPISRSAPDSGSGSGKIYGIPGDTLVIVYVDPDFATDSVTSSGIPVVNDTSAAVGVFPTTILVGGSLTPYVTDTDENRNGLLRETATVTITNNRTGETETLVLIETDSNSGVFDSAAILVTNNASDSASGSGVLFAVPSDTLTIRHVDRNDPTDSVTSGGIRAYWDTAPSSGVFPSSVKLGDSVNPVITDSNENRNGTTKETVTVTITNSRTGETETLVLTETDSNSGVFDVATLIVSPSAADSLSGSGKIYGVAGDTLVVRYVDQNDPTDSTTSSGITLYNDTSFSSGTVAAAVKFNDSMAPTVTDSDENRNGLSKETVTVTVTNNRTGETEALVLTETDSNSGIFGVGTLTVSPKSSDSASGSGKIFGLAGDTFSVRYVDQNQAADSFSLGPVTAYWDTSAAVGVFPTTILVGGSLTPYVTDTDENRNGLLRETATVTITNNRTGETETLVLIETDSNSGVFDSAAILVTNNASDSASGSGVLFAVPSDTLTIRYVDRNDPTDSVTSGGIRAYWDTAPSSGVFPPNVKSGDSIVPIITDSDENRDGTRIDTIAVTVRNARTGETEVIILYETDSNSGIFDVTKIFVTGNPADSVDNDTLFALAADTITVSYVDPNDPTDSTTGGPFAVYLDSSRSSCVPPAAMKIGDSIGPRVTDTDQNLNGTKIDTITVTITNARTGETEVIILYETDSNSGVFDVTRIFVTWNPADSVDNDTIYALPGDTITVRYVDPTDPTDSALGGPFSVFVAATVCTGTFPTSLKSGDSIVPIIRDPDQNLDGTKIDTITVTITNARTGETEVIILYETDSNSGIFDVTKIFVTGNPADSVDNDTLFALAGDTITVSYVDPNDPTDSVTGGPFSVFIDTTPSSGTFPTSLKSGDSIVPIIRDPDQNLDGTKIDTVAVTVRNARTGETEVIILYETDSNSGIFDVTKIFVTGNPADSVDNDTLFALAGDTITVSYVDPNDPTDSVTGGPFSVFIETSAASGLFVNTVKIGDSLTPIVRDSDRNISGLVRDTIAVTVTNARTGETEVIILIETDSNSGVFDVTTIFLSSNPADSVDNDTLFALTGDTITVRYVDPGDPTDSAVSGAITAIVAPIRSSLTVATTRVIGDSAYPTVTDSDENRNAFVRDTIFVIFTNPRTGETEPLILLETDSNSGVFDVNGLLTSKNPADSISASGVMYVRITDTLVLSYTDPDDAFDSASSAVQILSAFAGTLQQIDVFREMVGSDTYKFTFVPTNGSGDTQPGLDGEPFTAEIIDSEGGTGNFTEFRTFISGDSATYFYNRVENARLWLRVTLHGETFFPITIITGGDSNPTVVVGREDTTLSEGIMIIPAGFYDTDLWKLMVEPYFDYAVETEPLKFKTDDANVDMSKNPGRAVLPLMVRPEHQFLIRNTRTGEYLHNLDTWIEVSITYPDTNDDGIVDGTTIREGTLQMYYLDVNFNKWILVPDAVHDEARNVVTTRVKHLTIFTLVGVSAATNATGVVIYPNPFRPNDNNADNGREFVAGDLTTGILMDNVPAGAKVRVYTTLGERVTERTVNTAGTYQWDVKNDVGRPLASGVYIVVIDAPNGTRLVDKIAVIR